MRVHADDDGADSRLDSTVQPGRGEAAGVVDHADAVIARGRAPDDAPCAIRAPPVGDENLDALTRVCLRQQRVEARADESLLVATGHDDRDHRPIGHAVRAGSHVGHGVGQAACS